MARSRTDTGAGSFTRDSARTRWEAVPRSLELRSLPWLIPFAIAAGYLILFVVRLPHNVEALGWNPGVGSAYVMPETLVNTGSGGHTVMGSSPQWVSLWFGLVTAWMPFHRELWFVAPTLMFILSALIVGWSVDQLASRRAAILAVLLCVVASPIALTFFMAPFSHNTVYPCTALLGAYLIWLTRARSRKLLVTIAVPPILGVVVGTCLSSDFLLAATGVVPLGIAALLALLRRNRGSRLVSLSAFATIAVAIPIAKVTSSTMKSLGFLVLPEPIKYATVEELPARAELLFRGLKALFDGFLGDPEHPGTLHSELGLISTVVMCVALGTLLVLGILVAVRFFASGLRAHASLAPDELARSLHVIFWVSSTACACGAFWIAGEGPTTLHESYYANAIFAVGAVIPLLLSTRSPARLLIPLGATLFFIASFVALTHDYVNITESFSPSAKRIVKIAEANHLQTGYTNFGDASGVTWSTDNRVIMRPVEECPNPEGTNLCPGFQAYVPSWYVPQQRHTFLVVDSIGIEVRSLPPGLGKPLAVYSAGTLTMYVYPYDIATRFGRSF